MANRFTTSRCIFAALALACAGAVYFIFAPKAAALPIKFDAYVASLKARGEPTVPADIMREPLPNKGNAIWYLKQAAAAIALEHMGPSSSCLPSGAALPYGDEWNRQAADMMEANPRVFELVREAARHKIDWGISFEVVNSVNVPKLESLGDYIALRGVLADAALYHHFCGDDAAAMAAMQDILFCGDAMADYPLMIGYLVASINRSVASKSIHVIAGGLTIRDAAHPADPVALNPARREDVQKVIRWLLDDETLRQQYRKALAAERLVFLVNAKSRQASEAQDRYNSTYTAVMDEAIEASRSPHLPPLPQVSADKLGLAEQIAGVRSSLFETIRSQRMAAIDLATQLYRSDTGHSPSSLSDLVPAYLPAVPADPLAKEGRPLTYISSVGR